LYHSITASSSRWNASRLYGISSKALNTVFSERIVKLQVSEQLVDASNALNVRQQAATPLFRKCRYRLAEPGPLLPMHGNQIPWRLSATAIIVKNLELPWVIDRQKGFAKFRRTHSSYSAARSWEALQ
jgi:hypothetical protein